MADGVNIHLSGDEELRAKLEKLSSLVGDMRLFAPYVVPLFIGWMRGVFETEGEAGLGRQWAPLSPAYAAQKSHRYPGKSILIREGNLRRASSSPRRESTSRTLTLWIDDETAGYHQDGTDHMPPRPLIPSVMPAGWLAELDAAATEHVSTLIRSVGLL